MRALGWPDAFPAADAVLMKALGVRTAPQARAAAQVWHPWRGYAVVHLWRQAAAARTRPVEPAPSTPLQGDRDGLRDPAE
jgi:AraC family transcriptional regulator of adaptative response / DNA-3-methyladenine glycosylase II